MAASWDQLCRAHYAGGDGASAVRFAKLSPREERAARSWLCDEVAGSRYAAAFASEPFRIWPIREAKSDFLAAGVRLMVLGADGADVDGATATFVADEFLPALRQTASLLRAVSPLFTEVIVTYADIDRPRAYSYSSAPGPGFVISPMHINGGVTFATPGQPPRIVVYRREDATKVLVHELVHAAGIDRALHRLSSREAEAADVAFGHRHDVESVNQGQPLGLSEAYTETLACYLHSRWWRAAFRPRRMRPTARRVDAVLAAHIEAVARALDAAASGGGASTFREGTHGFAYAVCRAAIWATSLRSFLTRWPPGHPPRDPAAFAEFLSQAIVAWGRQRGAPSSTRTTRSLRMTPLQRTNARS